MIQSREPTGSPPGTLRAPLGAGPRPPNPPACEGAGARARPHGNGTAARQGALSAPAPPHGPATPGLLPPPCPGTPGLALPAGWRRQAVLGNPSALLLAGTAHPAALRSPPDTPAAPRVEQGFCGTWLQVGKGRGGLGAGRAGGGAVQAGVGTLRAGQR